MNKQTIIELLQDGAYLNVSTYQLCHHSFKNGFRKMLTSNISWCAASRELGNRLVLVDGIYSLHSQTQSR